MKMSKWSKRLVASAISLVVAGGMLFAETHETLKAHSLQTSIGDISFGAWGRSTFEFGHKKQTTKVSADTTALGDAALTAGAEAYASYCTVAGSEAKSITDDDFATDFSTKMGATLGDGVPQALQAIQGMALVSTLKTLDTNGEVTDTSNYAALEPDWSYGNRIGFWIVGRTPDEHFGFDFNLDADARALFVHKLWDSDESSDDVNYNEDGKYAVAIGDQAKIWGLFDNPLFQTKVAFGRMREQELRGTIGDFGQRESSDVKSEDDIFQEIWTATGLFLSVKGMEDSILSGFYANAMIDPAGTLGLTTTSGTVTARSGSATDTDSDKEFSLYKVMRSAQAGLGYTMPGLFQVKAQYWGDSIDETNYRYSVKTYKSARENGGYGINDYYGRLEFGIDWLGFMGGATSFLDPALNLEETPNANLIEVGFKLPLVTREGLRDYDPEKFYNWYACLGTMGVIEKGFILYKGHIWGGQGTSNLGQYTDITGNGTGLLTMAKGDGADIFMAGVDFLTEVCINPFGKQDVFVGLSGNYNITSASGDGNAVAMGASISLQDLELKKHCIAAELYVKKTFAANNFMFAGIAGNFQIQSMEGTVSGLVDLSYKSSSKKFYMPIGVELFF